VNSRLSAALLILILAGSFALKLHHLDHAAVKPLDEVFHAIVARNFLKHPLTPTLVDRPFLAVDRDDWLNNHIWLHKPPLALWQISASFFLLGVNTLALRLPSAILSTLAAWLTYLIGCRLLDRTTALVAATLQAFNPGILMLVHGYVFSDHVDISLLFWTELSIYFLVRGLPPTSGDSGGEAFHEKHRRVFLILCGIAQGLAFLSKTYPALITTVLAIVAIRSIRRKGILTLVLSTIATIAPWLIWTAIRFPHEFARENLQILHHLNENVENWAAPWDQLVFYYWISIFHVFYPAIIAAAAAFLLRAYQEKRLASWLILAWAAGVMVPHLLATSKPMTATLIGWPAAWLMFGNLVSRAVRGDRLALGTWLASMLLAILFLHHDSIPTGGENWGRIPVGFAVIMRQHLWVLWHVLAALAAGAILSMLAISPKVRRFAAGFAAAAAIFLAAIWWKGDHPPGYFKVAVEVTQINANTPDFADVGQFAARLPANSAFLVDERSRLENKLVEFAVDRSCYPATEKNWPDLARQLEQAGALPYLFTSASPEAKPSGPEAKPSGVPLPVVHVDLQNGRTVYACTPAAKLAAGAR
jgi:4-amino-4-deoxy-L-arabinose transferase-like glycosyltransferase